MKKLLFVALTGVLSFGVSGCSTPPYTEVGIQRGTALATVYVVVPDDATESDMRRWAAELEEKRRGRSDSVMVNFYHGSRGVENMVAVYSGGTLVTVKK